MVVLLQIVVLLLEFPDSVHDRFNVGWGKVYIYHTTDLNKTILHLLSFLVEAVLVVVLFDVVKVLATLIWMI